jgi:hypothetical protein
MLFYVFIICIVCKIVLPLQWKQANVGTIHVGDISVDGRKSFKMGFQKLCERFCGQDTQEGRRRLKRDAV